MADEPVPGPLTSLITEANEGRLSLRMSPEGFAKIERECVYFQDHVIREIQQDVRDISRIGTWGFGDHAGSTLTSAPTMANRFRAKSMGHPSGDDFYTVLEEHWRAVEDIRQLHATIRDRFIAQDAEFAARFNAEVARLDQLANPSGQPGVTGPVPGDNK
ncbi:hypothetical protein ABZ942_13610 [Nocardia sp. NPDC046473]|uniref:hypothetical protein n=1 Tax=Nocardia sp. NPDC046473 TaxID=3155733 RepID=UPI0033D84A6C